MQRKRLTRSFFRREPGVVARGLLGHTLVHVVNGIRLAGIIVETEAYLGVVDKACHSYGGRRTRRTETMYGQAGTSYVYLNYGVHRLFNIVVAKVDDPKAVLIRALEPTEGFERMYENRPAAKSVVDLCSGPGKLGAALQIELDDDGVDLACDNRLFVEHSGRKISSSGIVSCPRIGVGYAEEWSEKPLRFYLHGSPHVSKKTK